MGQHEGCCRLKEEKMHGHYKKIRLMAGLCEAISEAANPTTMKERLIGLTKLLGLEFEEYVSIQSDKLADNVRSIRESCSIAWKSGMSMLGNLFVGSAPS